MAPFLNFKSSGTKAPIRFNNDKKNVKKYRVTKEAHIFLSGASTSFLLLLILG
jgi:hypothetical protein